jgi:hypothetical protein
MALKGFGIKRNLLSMISKVMISHIPSPAPPTGFAF